MKKILFCLLAFYTPVSIVIAQNTTNSPTSMFGLGELSTGEGGQYAGLGGTGIALRGNNFLNNANPASLTELTEQGIPGALVQPRAIVVADGGRCTIRDGEHRRLCDLAHRKSE